MYGGWNAHSEFTAVVFFGEGLGNGLAAFLEVGDNFGDHAANAGERRFRRLSQPAQRRELDAQAEVFTVLR